MKSTKRRGFERSLMIGTSIEIGVSTLLLIGLLGRLPAFILFVFNIMAAASYPFLWTNEGSVGLQMHFLWGAILLGLMLHGSGKFTLDYLFKRYVFK